MSGDKFRLALYGLGPIGREIGRAAIRRGHTIVAAVDRDRELVGRANSELLGLRAVGDPLVTDAVDRALGDAGANVAIVSTVSRLVDVAPHLSACVRHGLDVNSTSEELTNPPSNDEVATRPDALARSCRRTIVGAGVNPGFLMDALPLALTAPCLEVTAVRVKRVLDASSRRQSFRDKVGLGLSLEEYAERAWLARSSRACRWASDRWR